MKDRHKVVPAAHMILRRGDEIFMLRRCNTGYSDGYLALPAGHVESGETLKAGAIREAFEESGVNVHPSHARLIHTVSRPGANDYERLDCFFETTVWEGEPMNAEAHKCDLVTWIDLANIENELITPYVKDALVHIREGRVYSESNE